MRFDDFGLFWEDLPPERGRNKIARVMPGIPDTGWRPPSYYPDLREATVISIDTETYDPELIEFGPGWARGVGHIVGISVCALFPNGEAPAWYFPIRHEIEPEMNMCPETTLRWLSDSLNNPHQPKVGANLTYDIGWLRHEGVRVAGDYYDVQFAEALLDESARVALDILGEKYLAIGKQDDLLKGWCLDYYGGSEKHWRANIYRTPPRLAGAYAEADAYLPLKIIEKQFPLMEKSGLLELFELENGLIDLMVDMRFAGVTVDLAKAEETSDRLKKQSSEALANLNKLCGMEVNVNASKSLSKAFDKLSIPYPKTAKENPSFTKAYLDGLNHPVGEIIRDIRKCDKLSGTFIDSYILNSHVNGKVYGQFHQLRGDAGGTRSGRYSSSTPNLQNIPSRDEIWAPLIRGIFIPDQGHPYWRKYDYSQIEYRGLLHYAVGLAGLTVRDFFNANPDTDYHDYTQQIVENKTGMFIERKPIKNINFGLIYGMGLDALAGQLGIKKKKAKELMAAYFEGAPFAKETMEACMEEASSTGVITTILGRRSRFDTWEPKKWTDTRPPLPYDKAVLQYGNIKRAYTHKALNRKLQGSAADLMKKAMKQCWDDGIFAETGVPRLTVHDELDFSDPGGKDEAFAEMQHIMETALPMLIPIKTDYELGTNWGNTKLVRPHQIGL